MEPILSLALSMHSNKGVYALLLGSGISRSAGIPTGWEVVLDLVRKLAEVQHIDCDPDPAAWYQSKYGEAPGYSKLLDEIAKTPAERNQLLRGYFEPTEAEREQGLKVPTPAHHAIANLVSKNYIRVIITTNFDRLLENALENEGIVPTIISTPDAVEGAIPLVHSQCTIIKVHGDYLDTRIKNTEAELSQYDEHLDKLLDRVFDEFGLIVSGWSGDWDPALRAAIERCPNRRFTTYWTGRKGPTGKAKDLVELRKASFLQIKDADTFFQDLAEKVAALEEMNRPHPLSAQIAIATLKHYLVDERHRIRLHDLVMDETERVHKQVFSLEAFPLNGTFTFSGEELIGRIHRYESATEILMAMMATGCYWGEQHQQALWVKSLERIAKPETNNGLEVLLKLRLYPALLLLYAGGIAAIAGERYGNLAALLTQANIKDSIDGREVRLGMDLNPRAVMEKPVQQKLPGRDRGYTPLSNHLFEVLRGCLREFLPSDTDYERYFDRFEYLLALVAVDLYSNASGVNRGAFVGRFGWRRGILDFVEQEFSQAGQNWLPLQAGLFGGDTDRFLAAKQHVDSLVNHQRWGWF